MPTVITWDDAVVNRVFRAPTGMVGMDMARRAGIVLASARTLVHVAPPPDPDAPPRTRARGTLRASLTVRPEESPLGPRYLVGSDDPIGLIHHQGTAPHDIYPRHAGGKLVFYWDRKQSLVAFPMVHHPGTRPNQYLTKALPLAIVNQGYGR